MVRIKTSRKPYVHIPAPYKHQKLNRQASAEVETIEMSSDTSSDTASDTSSVATEDAEQVYPMYETLPTPNLNFTETMQTFMNKIDWWLPISAMQCNEKLKQLVESNEKHKEFSVYVAQHLKDNFGIVYRDRKGQVQPGYRTVTKKDLEDLDLSEAAVRKTFLFLRLQKLLDGSTEMATKTIRMTPATNEVLDSLPQLDRKHKPIIFEKLVETVQVQLREGEKDVRRMVESWI